MSQSINLAKNTCNDCTSMNLCAGCIEKIIEESTDEYDEVCKQTLDFIRTELRLEMLSAALMGTTSYVARCIEEIKLNEMQTQMNIWTNDLVMKGLIKKRVISEELAIQELSDQVLTNFQKYFLAAHQ
mgnify:CR=1 FL=1